MCTQDFSLNKTAKIPTLVALTFRWGHIGKASNKRAHYIVGKRVVSAVGKGAMAQGAGGLFAALNKGVGVALPERCKASRVERRGAVSGADA